MSQQLFLDLTLPPSLGSEDYFVSPSNQEAYQWIKQWPQWPTSFLCVHGDGGCGKTHLAHIWETMAQATFISGANLTLYSVVDLLRRSPHIIIDDAMQVREPRALLHLLNLVKENNGYLLLTESIPPPQWPFSLPDLTSRLHTIATVGINPPDEMLLQAVLLKLFHDQQLHISKDVIAYLLKHMERSFNSAKSIVQALNEKSLRNHSNITIKLAREVLLRDTSNAL